MTRPGQPPKKKHKARAGGQRSPHRTRGQHILIVCAFTAAMAFVSQWLEFRGWESGFERSFKDFLLVHPYDSWVSNEPRRPDPRIAIVVIDDAAYAQCFEPPNILTPGTILQMLSRLDDALPRDAVVAIDLLTDASGYADVMVSPPTKVHHVYATGAAPRASDERFLHWLKTDEGPTYLVAPTDILGKPLGIRVPIEPAGGKESWGVPTYPTDGDGVLRRLPHAVQLTIDKPDLDRPTFAGAVAEAVGKRRDEREDVFMDFSDWRPGTDLKTFSAASLFSCQRQPAGAKPAPVQVDEGAGMGDFKAFASPIVLLGATYEGSRDRHETPRGAMSGVELNAYAIRSQRAARSVTEVPVRWMLLIEWIGACVVLLAPYLVPEAKREYAKVAIRITAFVAFVVAGFWLHSMRSMWPGVIWAYEYVWEWIKDRVLSPE